MNTILVVDDEPIVLSLVGRILELAGYSVFLANRPSEALMLAQGNRIDILLTDVVMPGMSGPVLAEGLVRLFPALKGRCIFMSGYTFGLSFPEGAHFIPKPFQNGDLLAKVREVLDHDGG